MGDEERWREEGSINYNTILQLDMFCKKKGKWAKVPYVQLFFFPKRQQMQARCPDNGNPL
jgi:hypothetical protein